MGTPAGGRSAANNPSFASGEMPRAIPAAFREPLCKKEISSLTLPALPQAWVSFEEDGEGEAMGGSAGGWGRGRHLCAPHLCQACPRRERAGRGGTGRLGFRRCREEQTTETEASGHSKGEGPAVSRSKHRLRSICGRLTAVPFHTPWPSRGSF